MSTSFDVYPSSAEVPTFDVLLVKATSVIRRRLASAGVGLQRRLRFRLVDDLTNGDLGVRGDQPFRWRSSAYAWFFFEGLAGGTDVRIWNVKDGAREEFGCQLRSGNPRAKATEAALQRCLTPGHFWRFRRSAGQSALIALSYGLIAASLAELTGGLLWTGDNAWDFGRFPATAAEFLSFYMQPDRALSVEFRGWAERCWRNIPGEAKT